MVKSWVLRKSLIFSMIIGFATVAFGNDIADLEALEAELAEETNETSAADPSVLFTGNFKILVSRPIYAPYSEEKETKWISAVSEPFFRFKISALPKPTSILRNKLMRL